MNPFDDERLQGARSSLVRVMPDEQGRFSYELWCQYTRIGLDNLQVGDLIGVENYTPANNGSRIYSVLALSQVYPMHFAAQEINAYPGHVFEAMRSIKNDWETQERQPLYLTTTIKVIAVPTGYQFVYDPRNNDRLPGLDEERNIPMIGAEIRLLSQTMVDAIINQGMEEEPNSPFTHKKFDDINIRINQESLLTTHFGIFGFTGVGKSNLVSSLVSSLCFDSDEPRANFVVLDPNDEYLGLFIDRFVSNPEEVSYIHVGSDSLHGLITRELGNPDGPSDKVMGIMMRQLRLPPPLQARLKSDENFKDYILRGLRSVFGRTRIALPYEDVSTLIRAIIKEQTPERSGPQTKEAIAIVLDSWTRNYIGLPMSQQNILNAIDFGSRRLDRGPIENLQGGTQLTAEGVITRTIRALQREADRLENIPVDAIVQIDELIQRISAPRSRHILVVTGRRDLELKHFASLLGNDVYEARRNNVEREPFISFVFDEADMFLPQAGSDQDTLNIRDLCVTLARRGRKFGIGLGISTQRSSLLDTEVMANLHTYLVSKLPRQADRQKVAEAFGISDDQLAPTFTFRRGNWLIISHDATGLKGVPIPAIAEDANARIAKGAGQ